MRERKTRLNITSSSSEMKPKTGKTLELLKNIQTIKIDET